MEIGFYQGPPPRQNWVDIGGRRIVFDNRFVYDADVVLDEFVVVETHRADGVQDGRNIFCYTLDAVLMWRTEAVEEPKGKDYTMLFLPAAQKAGKGGGLLVAMEHVLPLAHKEDQGLLWFELDLRTGLLREGRRPPLNNPSCKGDDPP